MNDLHSRLKAVGAQGPKGDKRDTYSEIRVPRVRHIWLCLEFPKNDSKRKTHLRRFLKEKNLDVN